MIAPLASPRRPMRLADACYQALRLTGWLAVTLACVAALWLLFFVPGWIAWTVISLWFLYRIVRGMLAMGDNRPVHPAA